MTRQHLRLVGCFAATGIILLLSSGSSQATPIGLIPGTPDVFSSFLTLDYTTGSPGTMTVTGFALSLHDGTTDHAISLGTFDLSAAINSIGDLTTGPGSMFSIGGTIAGLGFNSGTLLTGSLTSFGFAEDGTDTLEFLFDVTGGDAAGLYGAGGGMILSGTGFPGNFEQDFSGAQFQTTADTFGVPEPSSLLLMSLGLLLAARRRQS